MGGCSQTLSLSAFTPPPKPGPVAGSGKPERRDASPPPAQGPAILKGASGRKSEEGSPSGRATESL